MKRTEAPTDTELAAYIARELSTARAAEIDAWVADDRANGDRTEAVRLLLTVRAQGGVWDRDRIWSTVRSGIDRDEATSRTRPVSPARSVVLMPPSVGGRAAASFGRPADAAALAKIAAVVIAIGFGAHYMLSGNSLATTPKTAVANLGSQSPLAAGAPAHEYSTARGMRATVQLSDGSRVTLAPESRLRVAAAFGVHDRSVELEGEAEFDVVHDSTRPFSVKAGHAIVVDIGTRFDLRAYATDTNARVAVAEGAVTLGSYTSALATSAKRQPEGVLIRKGEVGQLDAVGHAVTEPITGEATYFGWAAGHLAFERAPLRDVLGSIARWYDVEITVPDTAVANRLVTAQFSTESPADIVMALAQAVNASVVGSGRVFTLRSR